MGNSKYTYQPQRQALDAEPSLCWKLSKRRYWMRKSSRCREGLVRLNNLVTINQAIKEIYSAYNKQEFEKAKNEEVLTQYEYLIM
jgi:hypothetical protein